MIELPALTHGRISKRQSTYLVFERITPGPVASFRIDFKNKLRFSLDCDEFDAISITYDHPLLIDFAQPKQNIFIGSSIACAKRVVQEIETAVSNYYGGWHRYDRDDLLCLNDPINLLQGGHGLLFRGPTGLISEVSRILNQAVVQHSILEAFVPDPSPLEVLLLGSNFVVAQAFKIQEGEA